MRRLVIVIIAVIAVAAGVCIVTATLLRHRATDQVRRAEALAAELRMLTVGSSDYKTARAIATMFGTVPYYNDYGGTPDCAEGYFERCGYRIAINHNRVMRHPFLRHLGLHDWVGTALIYIENGIVQEYLFRVSYKTSDGRWRDVGVGEGNTIPKDLAVQARISDSYAIQRNDFAGEPSGEGFGLESSLIPTSNANESRRAWHFELKCLSQQRGCGEICEVIPDVWRDFYIQRGHFDVEKYGSAYLLCAEPQRQIKN